MTYFEAANILEEYLDSLMPESRKTTTAFNMAISLLRKESDKYYNAIPVGPGEYKVVGEPVDPFADLYVK